jgi:hypothetical protein
MVFATIGVFWGVCGFGSLRVHPAFLAWLLG